MVSRASGSSRIAESGMPSALRRLRHHPRFYKAIVSRATPGKDEPWSDAELVFAHRFGDAG